MQPGAGHDVFGCHRVSSAARNSGVMSPAGRPAAAAETGEITMSKFMILYRAPGSARDQMANATPEQLQAGLEAWRAWASRVDYAIADLGTPLAHTAHVGAGAASTDGICGYSILEAGSAEEIETVLNGNPQLAMPGGSAEILEIIPIGEM
jgi:hypothetical protein